ncbi:MAG: glycosyltransferase family 2 protein [Desulfobacterales bacterium]|nr:glycosyltransferase family 2 protein [Desulfobacterales bacterium]
MSLLSIIIPIYNAEKTIQRTLDSLNHIKKKHQPDVEVVFVNDGSTDASREIIEKYVKENTLLKTILLNQENRGTSFARNSGLKVSNGEWIFFLDADDELNFDPIAWTQKFPENTAMGFSGEFYKNFKRRVKIRPLLITEKNFLDVYTSRNPFPTPCLLFKKNRLDSLFEPSFTLVEDWLFWTMNPEIFEKMMVFPKTVSAKINIHGENKSSNQIKHGEFREKVVGKVLESYGKKLTQKQRNNLMIQRGIGKLMQRKTTSLSMFVKIPCGFRLYIKFILYFFFQRINEKVGPYAK